MRRSRVLGAGLLGALALSALLATSATAGEYNLKMLPELGRCVFVGRHLGEFRGNRCMRSEPGVGRYEWHSGPGAKNKFTGKLKEPITLTSPKSAIACHSGEAEGEYTGPKNMKITKLVLTSCKNVEGNCENEGSTVGEISAEALNGEMGYISHPKKLRVGWDLKPASGSNLAAFVCGATEAGGKGVAGGVKRELRGSVIGKIEPVDHMTTEFGLTQEIKKGAQLPEKFEGGVKDTLSTLVTEKLPGTGKSTEATMAAVKDLFKNEEALEVLGRCVGAGC